MVEILPITDSVFAAAKKGKSVVIADDGSAEDKKPITKKEPSDAGKFYYFSLEFFFTFLMNYIVFHFHGNLFFINITGSVAGSDVASSAGKKRASRAMISDDDEDDTNAIDKTPKAADRSLAKSKESAGKRFKFSSAT